MTSEMRGKWTLIGLVALFVLLLAYAWLDGGREPVHPISQPVPLPEVAG